MKIKLSKDSLVLLSLAVLMIGLATIVSFWLVSRQESTLTTYDETIPVINTEESFETTPAPAVAGEFKELNPQAGLLAVDESAILAVTPTISATLLSDNLNAASIASASPIILGNIPVIIRGEGLFSRPGARVDFWFRLPSDGGGITGQGTGTCTGSLKGDYFADRTSGSGSLTGECLREGKPIAVSGQFSLKLDLSTGTAHGTFEGSDGANKTSGEFEALLKIE